MNFQKITKKNVSFSIPIVKKFVTGKWEMLQCVHFVINYVIIGH